MSAWCPWTFSGIFNRSPSWKNFPQANRGTESAGCSRTGWRKAVNDTQGIAVMYSTSSPETWCTHGCSFTRAICAAALAAITVLLEEELAGQARGEVVALAPQIDTGDIL